MSFRKIDPTELPGNAIDEICNKWMLLAAGTEDDFNFMTINWGMLGELWFKPAMTVYVRHSRHTFGYMENNDVFTVTCLKPGHEDALKPAGSKSGRDIDKLKESGLTKTMIDGAPTFEKQHIRLCARKCTRRSCHRKTAPICRFSSMHTMHRIITKCTSARSLPLMSTTD